MASKELALLCSISAQLALRLASRMAEKGMVFSRGWWPDGCSRLGLALLRVLALKRLAKAHLTAVRLVCAEAKSAKRVQFVPELSA